MHVLAIVAGLLLLLFGGGCTLIGLVVFFEEPRAFMADAALILSIWVPFGVAPLAGGWLLFRHGMKRDREKRLAKAPVPPKEE